MLAVTGEEAEVRQAAATEEAEVQGRRWEVEREAPVVLLLRVADNG